MRQRHYIAGQSGSDLIVVELDAFQFAARTAATALGTSLLWRGMCGTGLSAAIAIAVGAELCARGTTGKSLWKLFVDDNIGGNQPDASDQSAILNNDFPGQRQAEM